MIKYFIQTFYRLPPSKHLLESPHQFIPILKALLKSRPKSLPTLKESDVYDSINMMKIDTQEVTNWQTVFSPKPIWDWNFLLRKEQVED